MAFTEYKFDKDAIKALVAERAVGLRANRGFSNLLGFGLGVVAERLQKDPRRYRDYGPYWWALKDALAQLETADDVLAFDVQAGWPG